MAILNDNEFTEVEGRYYSNPQVALDENNTFIDNLRSTQQANNQEIQTQTYNLGSELPSQIGGLGAPGDTSLSYFTSRYQVPQTNAAVANLRATAQAAALNEVLSNEQAKWKNRYQQAYRNYQKRQYNRSYGGGGGGNTETPQTTAGQGDVTTTVTDDELEARGKLNISGSDISNGGQYIVSPDVNRYGGHDIIWVTPSGQNITIPQLSDGSYTTTDVREFVRAHGGANLPFIGSN